MNRRIPSVAAALVLTLAVLPVTATPAPSDDGPQRLVVDTRDLPEGTVPQAVAAVGGEVLRVDERLDVAVVRAPQDPLEGLLGDRVHVDARGGGDGFVPDDPRWDDQWGPRFLQMPEAWALKRGDRDVLVGVVDSGIDADHEDLAGVPVELGLDYVEGDQTPQDEHGHGTHVAGIVAAQQDNGVGVAGMAQASLFVNRVFDENNVGFCSHFASGIADAVDAGADVVNFSGYCGFPLLMQRAAAYAEAHDVLLVTSTGNKGSDMQSCWFADWPDPGPTVLSVGAIRSDGNLASYSCREPYVDLVAPGSAVVSTLPGDYGPFWGTSMAAPHVTATAALLESQLLEAPAEALRALILATADEAGGPGRDFGYGHGILDPDEALERVQASGPLVP